MENFEFASPQFGDLLIRTSHSKSLKQQMKLFGPMLADIVMNVDFVRFPLSMFQSTNIGQFAGLASPAHIFIGHWSNPLGPGTLVCNNRRFCIRRHWRFGVSLMPSSDFQYQVFETARGDAVAEVNLNAGGKNSCIAFDNLCRISTIELSLCAAIALKDWRAFQLSL
jgi:hypothetical protein